MEMLIVFSLNGTQTHTHRHTHTHTHTHKQEIYIYFCVYVYKFLYKNMCSLKSHYKEIEKEYITKENDVKKYIEI